jgi:lysophospholipase L1-like esterase|tara:strand:+ start:643 stop:1725 length:1083 start_codon:yes stop_codon:yes gene_type:complete
MSVQVSYRKQTIVGIFLLLIIIFSVEISLRTYEYITISCGIFENDAFSNLSYFEIKNICYSENTLVHEKAPLHHIVPNQYKFTMSINSDGFRGNEINLNTDKYRIFFTGGSTAFGFGSTSDKTTISGFLQEYFDNEFTDLNVQIINAGINGADSYREILLIKEKLIGYDPDLIISYTGVNDSGGYSREIIFDETKDDSTKNLFKFASYPWYRTPFVINNMLSENVINEKKILELSTEEIQKNSESFKKNWTQSCVFLEDNQITSVLILQPSLITKTTVSDFEKSIEPDVNYRKQQLEKFSNELELLNEHCNYTLDLRYAINNTSETTYYDNVHMNDLGNQIIAKTIYEKILPIVIEDLQK